MWAEFLKGFWVFLSGLVWWQATIVICLVITSILLAGFWKKVIGWVGNRLSYKKKEIQFKMFWGMIRDTLNTIVKDEIRRSFKENGFEGLGGAEFASYVKEKSKQIISIIEEQTTNFYPPSHMGTVVKMDDVLEFINDKEREIEDIVFEIFIEAKKFAKQGKDDTEAIDLDFAKEVSEYIEDDAITADCERCLLVLFGKREIAEHKKEKIKILKSQMTFAEQKILELQMDFITFYNNKLGDKKKRS